MEERYRVEEAGGKKKPTFLCTLIFFVFNRGMMYTFYLILKQD